jgi:hypothetical protein
MGEGRVGVMFWKFFVTSWKIFPVSGLNVAGKKRNVNSFGERKAHNKNRLSRGGNMIL